MLHLVLVNLLLHILQLVIKHGYALLDVLSLLENNVLEASSLIITLPLANTFAGVVEVVSVVVFILWENLIKFSFDLNKFVNNYILVSLYLV